MRRKEQKLSTALYYWTKANGVENKYQEFLIDEIWQEILGNQIYAETESISLDKEYILTIKIKNPILKNELNYAKTKLKNTLNKSLEKFQIKELNII